MKNALLLVLFMLSVNISNFAQIKHDAFDALLKKHVSAVGNVNYKNFKNDASALESYINMLAENAPTAKTAKAEKMAFWINLYNALTIKTILDNYPLSSIQKLDNGKPWDVKKITIGDKKYSLNDIENNVLRPMGDARIHFAVNCAAKSCPPMANQAFTAANLNNLMDTRARKFVNDPKANALNGAEIKVSKIFEWYGKDFDKIPDFINRFASVKVKTDVKVGFKDYDWSLNE